MHLPRAVLYCTVLYCTVLCVQVCSSPELGRYLVATRDLKPGEMIISETPLVMGPQAVTIPVCLACYKPATSKYV